MGIVSEVYWDRGSRSMNQDSVSFQEVDMKGERIVFALVCDGIGGLWGGERASGFVMEEMTEWFYKEALVMLEKNKSGRKIEKAGLRALYGCNDKLGEYARNTGRKLGTTAAIFLLRGNRYFVWNSGDTRIYRIRCRRKGRMKRLTNDHAADERTLTRCIGSFKWEQPDVKSGSLKKRDAILICSDGFRNRIDEERMGETLCPKLLQSREQIYRRLKEIAGYVKKRGEKDNISAVLIKLE